MNAKIILSVFSLLVLTPSASAQIIGGDLAKGWVGEASLSGSKTTGNTDTTDLGLGLKLDKEGKDWTHKFTALADFGEADNVTNKQRFNLGYQIDRNLNERLYLYGSADYFQDDFGAFQDGFFLGSGFGYKALISDPLTWNLEGGIGYREQQEQGDMGQTFSEVAGRVFSDFDWAFNENVSAYNDTEVTFAESNTNIWNETGLNAQISGNLAARVSFRVEHNTDVAIGLEDTDTITRVGIVYSIK